MRRIIQNIDEDIKSNFISMKIEKNDGGIVKVGVGMRRGEGLSHITVYS